MNKYSYGIDLKNGVSLLVISKIESSEKLLKEISEKNWIQFFHCSTWSNNLQEKDKKYNMNSVFVLCSEIIAVYSKE